jgi:ankyrin repeat protein
MTETLHDAVGRPEVLRSLIERGVPLEARNEEGATALFQAVMAADEACVEILLAAGADPNAIADEPAATIYAELPLNLANQARFYMQDERYARIIELLTSYGARDPYWKRG